ncbi:MAG: cytochrome c-type biogenesis protein CcmH [Actinomycetota bacterium]|nr:cytochrome c-type biogenesis protein CcmH [Actinomycetota bacterium]
MKRKVFVVMIATILLLQALTTTAMALEVNDVAGEFICNCGCNQGLASCEMSCAKELRGFIKDKIDQGMGKEQIVQYMKVNFSEALLAAPEKTGFNWVAWITPFAVVIIGGVAIELAIRRWAGRRGDEDDGGAGGDHKVGPAVDKKYSDRVNEELKEFGW